LYEVGRFEIILTIVIGRALAKIHYIACDDVGISVFQVRGLISFSDLNEFYIKSISALPKRMDYALLLDLRLWEGLATDHELTAIAAKLKTMRAIAARDKMPEVIYVGTAGSGMEFLAQSMNSIRGGGVSVEADPVKAWQKLAPTGVPMPDRIRALLGA
jgi:hypothetical protein